MSTIRGTSQLCLDWTIPRLLDTLQPTALSLHLSTSTLLKLALTHLYRLIVTIKTKLIRFRNIYSNDWLIWFSWLIKIFWSAIKISIILTMIRPIEKSPDLVTSDARSSIVKSSKLIIPRTSGLIGLLASQVRIVLNLYKVKSLASLFINYQKAQKVRTSTKLLLIENILRRYWDCSKLDRLL